MISILVMLFLKIKRIKLNDLKKKKNKILNQIMKINNSYYFIE